MITSLKKKIELDFEKFFLEKCSGSRDNIFASSFEIEIKKRIREMFLNHLDDYTPEEEKILLNISNIIDAPYRYYIEKIPDKNYEKTNFINIMNIWLRAHEIYSFKL